MGLKKMCLLLMAGAAICLCSCNPGNNKKMAVIHEYVDSMVKIPGKNIAVGKTEVTQDLYTAVMGYNPSYHQDTVNCTNPGNLPVENVSWYDAVYFCNELSSLMGYGCVYSVNGETDPKKWNYTPHKKEDLVGSVKQDLDAPGFRLPLSEEWLEAAVAGDSFFFSGSNDADDVAWVLGNSNGSTHEVAQKKPNSYGLYDMNGNVWEWNWDFNRSRKGRSYKGGAWNLIALYSRLSAISQAFFPYYGDEGIGIRLVRTLPVATAAE